MTGPTESAQLSEWQSLWSPGVPSQEWCHTGIAVTPSGVIAFGAPEPGQLIVIDDDSRVGRRVDIDLTELHGISTTGERLWVADPGMKARPDRHYAETQAPGRVALVTLDGTIEREVGDPFFSSRTAGPWRPTSVAPIDDTGVVWVADGYGQSLLHLVDENGDLVLTVDGSETGVAFASPHGVIIWRTDAGSQLVIADRRNRRLVLLSLDGAVTDVVEHELLRSPSTFAADGRGLLLTELDGAILRVSPGGRVTSVVGRAERDEADDGWPSRDGWPNARHGGRLERPPLTDGVLNSPHGIAVDTNGEILLTEWVIGGRYLRLPRRDRGVASRTSISAPSTLTDWSTP